MNKKTPQKMQPKIMNLLIYAVALVLILAVFYMSTSVKKDEKPKYYEIVQTFEKNEVSEFALNLSNGKLLYKLVSEAGQEEPPVHIYSVPNVSIFKEDIHAHVLQFNRDNPDNLIKFDYEAGSANSWLVSMVPMLFSGLLLVAAVMYFMKKMNQTITSDTNRTLGFGKTKAQETKDEKTGVTFDDVAGADEEKEELREIVEFLEKPDRYNALGARIPKGVLLVGPPGTGKTLLARAVAGEAAVPFFYLSGSDFVEMYVGVGASRVRDLFEKAKKKAPSIVFIDEIDAVGRQRGAGLGGGNDEREQTLNQLLVEMDGFGVNEGVIVLAATNRSDILDPALTRPGRFDREVNVGFPDMKGRKEILQVHSRNKPLAPDVDLQIIAAATVGFTGADLENLMNEAALLTAKNNLKAITMREIQDATVKVMVGPEKASQQMTKEDKRLTAYHEGGHAVASFHLEHQDPVREISIIPRGQAGGYNLNIPEKDRNYHSRNFMLDEIVSLLGGRVAEEVVIGDISTGASNDIVRATEIARNMVTKYGMSEKLGPVAFNGGDEVFLGRDYSQTRTYSEAKAEQIDEEISRIISEAYERCRIILLENSEQLTRLANYLLVYEKMNGQRFNELMEDTFVYPQEGEELKEAFEGSIFSDFVEEHSVNLKIQRELEKENGDAKSEEQVENSEQDKKEQTDDEISLQKNETETSDKKDENSLQSDDQK